jgi:hypothetical protein
VSSAPTALVTTRLKRRRRAMASSIVDSDQIFYLT